MINYRIREFKEHNYKAIFNSKTGQTMRIAIDPTKPITRLKWPEIVDISLGTKCFGNCPYCYTSATSNGILYDDVIFKIDGWFGHMDTNERPFQVALGGGGEPTLHPDFCKVLRIFKELLIVPNYTTNTMHLTEEIINTTKEVCGGVAISCHPHLENVWRRGIKLLTESGIRTNLHIMVGEPYSTERFWRLFSEYSSLIDYFVLLPYQSMGRAKQVNTEAELTKLFDSFLSNLPENVAFGALLYPFLLSTENKYKKLNISLYEPEIVSSYLMLDNDICFRKSSFDLERLWKEGEQ